MATTGRMWTGGLAALALGSMLALAGCGGMMMGDKAMMKDGDMKKDAGMMKDDKMMERK